MIRRWSLLIFKVKVSGLYKYGHEIPFFKWKEWCHENFIKLTFVDKLIIYRTSCCILLPNDSKTYYERLLSIKKWVSFFLGSWRINRSVGQTNRVNREVVRWRFVCSTLRYIPNEPRKKDTHSLYLYCVQQVSFIKYLDKRYKFKFPTATGT